MTDVTTLIDLITRGGLVTALIIALVGGMKGWYVWKNAHEEAVKTLQSLVDENKIEYEKREEASRQNHTRQIEEIRKDRDYWRDQAIRSMSATGRITDVLEAARESK